MLFVGCCWLFFVDCCCCSCCVAASGLFRSWSLVDNQPHRKSCCTAYEKLPCGDLYFVSAITAAVHKTVGNNQLLLLLLLLFVSTTGVHEPAGNNSHFTFVFPN